MIRGSSPALAAVLTAALAVAPAWAQDAAVPDAATRPQSASLKPAEVQAPSPEAAALQDKLGALAAGANDEERNEHQAMRAFYEARGFAPLWTTSEGITAQAMSAIEELQRADDWGLRARDFAIPGLKTVVSGVPLAAGTRAAAELDLSLTLLKYARHARGGRIINPAEQLSSYLDRRPQLVKPQAVLEGLAAAPDSAAYLRSLHPQHPQFAKLRERYVALLRGQKPAGAEGTEARKLLANMEQWRWMPADMGSVYVWNNIPEFMQRVVKGGEVLRAERIVVGEISKQTPVFSRPLRRLTFKPTWIVPDSIKVNELWPSLLKGGGLMRKWALEVQTKDGKPVNWRTMDWTKTDIREFDVLQPNGPHSVMGKFKFSFPNQHTVFMHDTLPRDKYMFNVAQRAYSHGCIRVRNPQGLAELILKEEKGWDAEKVAQELNAGPNNNTIELDRRVFVHITYFTAMVNDEGKLETFRDVYGHERRIALALEGKWEQIRKGRDHLAPVELNLAAAERIRGEDGALETPGSKKGKKAGIEDFLTSLFGGF